MLLVKKKNMSLSTITAQRVQELFFFFQNVFLTIEPTSWPSHDSRPPDPMTEPWPSSWPTLWLAPLLTKLVMSGQFCTLAVFWIPASNFIISVFVSPLAQINVPKFDIFTAGIHELYFNVYFGINLSCDPINLMKVYTHNNQLKSWGKGQKQEINWYWWWAPGHMPTWTPAEKSSQYLQALSSLL